MRTILALFLVAHLASAALVEQGQVRLRYGTSGPLTSVSQIWADVVFEGPTSLPDLQDSESYDPYMGSDFVSLDDGPFRRIRVALGPARLSLASTSELLITAQCLTVGPHEITLSEQPCPCSGVPCLRGDTLCSFNSTEGLVELFADRPTLTPEVARLLRFGNKVELGPVLLTPGEPWIRSSSTGMTNRLSFESIVYNQVVHLDLGASTVCVERQEVEQHASDFGFGLNFMLVLIIAGLSSRSNSIIRQAALTLAFPLTPLPLLVLWTPVRLGLYLAPLVYLLPLVSILAGMAGSISWLMQPNQTRMVLVANGVWASLWYQQYQVDASTWDGLAGIIVLTAWTWVNIRGPLWWLSIVQVLVLWAVLTLRNPLLVPLPEIPAALFVALILFFWRQRNHDPK